MATKRFTWNLRDKSAHNTSFSVYVTGDAVDPSAPGLELTALETAMTALVDGSKVGRTFSHIQRMAAVLEGGGKRETRVGIIVEDTTTFKTYILSLGTVKPTLADNVIGETDHYDLTAEPWAAFKTAFEAVAKSQDGNALRILRIYRMGD